MQDVACADCASHSCSRRAARLLVSPWFGLHPSLGENLAIGALFTGISLVRGYALRRLFEERRHG